MKNLTKRLLLAAVLGICSASLLACGAEQTKQTLSTPSAQAATASKAEQPVPQNSNVEHLTLEANGKTFSAEIEHNALTEQFLSKVPRTLNMVQLRDTSVIYGDSPISMPNNLVRGLKKGDLAYCQYGYFIIFTGDQAASHTTGFIKVGRITSDNLDDLQALAHGAEVKFTLAK